MKDVLALLRRFRSTRREVAAGRVAAARKLLDAADAAEAHARAGTEQAWAWQAEVVQRRGRAAQANWRDAMLPSCEALVAQRVAVQVQAQQAQRVMQQQLQAQQAALLACERALLRTDELSHICDEQQQLAELAQEQSLDDDMAAAWRRRAAVGVAVGVVTGAPL